MLVFGDHVTTRDPRDVINDLWDELRAARHHDAWVSLFVDTSELAQGLADAARESRGIDARDPTDDVAMTALLALARSVAASWRGERVSKEPARSLLERLLDVSLPDTIRTRRAEGHAFYAVYPEAYYEAALRSGLRDPHVIGVRSIGCGLAAMVAVATGAGLPSTVRPVGDAFRRTVRVDERLLAAWTRARSVAIVDEGPGLSGSSFGAVLDVLEERGVARDRIACFPSHANDLGPGASEAHRTRWRRVARHVVDADDLLVRSGRLASALESLLGPLAEPLEDISAGAWRRYRAPAAPVVPQQERRKFLARTRDGTFVARFVGLGSDAQRRVARARKLAGAGFTPEVRGVVHGFLVERWVDGRALDPCAYDRGALLDHVTRYLRFRTLFATRPECGASADTLLAMARRNIGLALGEPATLVLDGWHPPALERRIRRIEVDGKLHAWEWVCVGDKLVKTDAIDHHAAHDLIGCQDLAWDVAGAAIELGLDGDELARRTSADPELVAFSRICYLAFQLGRYALAGADATAAHYKTALRAELYSARAAAECFEVR